MLFIDSIIASRVFQSSFCWAKGSMIETKNASLSERLWYVKCGRRYTTMLLSSATEEIKHPINNLQQTLYIASTFTASAAEADVDKKSRTSRRTDQPKKTSKHDKRSGAGSDVKRKRETKGEQMIKVVDRLKCKYRKSCYDQNYGTSFNEKNSSHRSKESQPSSEDDYEDGRKNTKTKAKNKISQQNKIKINDDRFDEISEDSDKSQIRLACKYRHSCYKKKGIEKIFEKDSGKKFNAAILTSTKQKTLTKNFEKPANVKDVAGDLLKRIEERKKSNLDKPKISNIEKILTSTKETKDLKNACKYRKSCYESGFVPNIESSLWPSAYTSSKLEDADDDTVDRKIVKDEYFDSLSVGDQKLLCKYRKSCYDNGIPPKTLTRTFTEAISEEKPEEKRIPLKVYCKYRKSCYENENAPEINKKTETKFMANKNEKSILPATVADLKLFCKYRKSCYVQMSEKESETEDDKDEEEDNKILENIEDEDEEKERIEIFDEALSSTIAPNIPRKTGKRPKAVGREPLEQESLHPKSKKAKKETREEFCQKTSNQELFGRSSEKNDPISKKIKGRQPNQPRSAGENEEIVVISSRKHPRKVKGTKTAIHDENNEATLVNELEEEKVSLIEEIIEVNEDESTITEEDEKKSAEDDDEKQDDDDDDHTVTPITPGNHYDEDKNSEDVMENKNDSDENGKNNEVTDNEDDDDYEDQRYKYVALNEKIACKYRKSCYTLDEKIEIPNDKLKVKKDPMITLQQRRMSETNWNKLRKEEMLRCKYRKSCYDDRHELDDLRIKFKKEVTNAAKLPTPNPSSYSNDKSQNHQVSGISAETKKQCKYRHSCYKEVDSSQEYEELPKNRSTKIIVAAVDEDRNRVMYMLPNGKKCCKYRMSCREQVGLPPKERAPVGPNGKKLCRKKKFQQ